MFSKSEKPPLTEETASPISPPRGETTAHLDKAYDFIQNQSSVDTGDVDIKAVRRKVDFRLIPIMLVLYAMQFLDKINLNVCLAQLTSLVIFEGEKGGLQAHFGYSMLL